MLDGQIYILHVKKLQFGEFVSDSDDMSCCLDRFVLDFILWFVSILIVEVKLLSQTTEDG